MTDTDKASPRRLRLEKRTRTRIAGETQEWSDIIRSRPDYTTGLEPFLTVLEATLDPGTFVRESDLPVVFTLCVQAPLELFRAAGLRPFRLACGSHSAGDMAPLHLPALTCPMMRSVFGLLRLDGTSEIPPQFVIPFTCDWVVNFSRLAGTQAGRNIHFMELPHLRESEAAAKQWGRQMAGLKSHLETVSGRKIKPKDILAAIRAYAEAWATFVRMETLRQHQTLPAIHFALMANALPYMDIEAWTEQAGACLSELQSPDILKTPVFLTGSPVVFPNYKLLELMDRAGLAATGDDLCTMGRVFPGAAAWEDPSEYALLRALGERHHKACTCPTFADNGRRLNALVQSLEHKGIQGVVFHVLKGCHPFDMEAGLLEQALKDKGFRFLKIETDYVKEDEQNIVTRLEAFSRTLSHDPGQGI